MKEQTAMQIMIAYLRKQKDGIKGNSLAISPPPTNNLCNINQKIKIYEKV